jgi:3-methyladenine DNA glycosylase AlkD
MTSLESLRLELRRKSSKTRARTNARYFKMGTGEYGEGDISIGVTVPDNRRLAKKFAYHLSLDQIRELLRSPIHEERLCALLISVYRYEKASDAEQKQIVGYLLKNTQYINNWDLVDSCAPYCIGAYVFKTEKNFNTLRSLARSRSLWERRIAIVATLYHIRQNEFLPTHYIAERLINDPHDLIHKATGWMLREMGKRDRQELVKFLDQHHAALPRTALRYSLEHFNHRERAHYMRREVTN